MSDISLYGFENNDGEPDEFRTLDLDEAIKYAKKYSLKLVEHVFEWTEQVPVEGHDYIHQGSPPNRLLAGIPPVGSRIRLGEIERFPLFRFDAGEIAVVKQRNFEAGVVWIELETEHEELEEWDNEVCFTAEMIGDDWPQITDEGDRLRMAFWSDVDEVLSEAEQTA
jgi:hypothetical protein